MTVVAGAVVPEPPGRSRRPVVWLPWIGLVVVVAVALAIGSQRHSTPTLTQRTMSIAGQVKCPECVGETAAESNVVGSVEIRDFIRRELVAGRSRSQILDDLQSSFGASILESPPARGINLVLWILPGVAVVVALVGLVALFRRWRPGRSGGVSDDDRQLVGVLLEPGPPAPTGPVPPVPTA